MEVTPQLYDWLTEIGVVTTGKSTDTGLMRLVEKESKQLEEGQGMETVLRSMGAVMKKPVTLPNDLLEAASSPSTRLYNWNALLQAFQSFGVTVDSDVKSLIVAGDRQMVAEVLTQLYRPRLLQLPLRPLPSHLLKPLLPSSPQTLPLPPHQTPAHHTKCLESTLLDAED
jgi:hypothetical protein